MSTDNKYNGYTNYQTWLVALWIDNDEYLCNDLMPEMALEAYKEASDSNSNGRNKDATYILAKRLESWCDDELEAMNMPSAGMFTDLLNSAIGLVDWEDIAENHIEAISTEDKAAMIAEETTEEEEV